MCSIHCNILHSLQLIARCKIGSSIFSDPSPISFPCFSKRVILTAIDRIATQIRISLENGACVNNCTTISHFSRSVQTARSSRSVSLDLHDIDSFVPCDLNLAPDDSESSSSSTTFLPKSPLGMFEFDLLEENESTIPSNMNPQRKYLRSRRFSTSFSTDTRMLSTCFRPSDTAAETHSMEQHDHDTQRPLPVTRAYVPRYIRDRENATAVTPPSSPLSSSRWTSRHHNERSEELRTLDSMVEMTSTDAFSYSNGNEVYGITSLLGVRNNMEDLCCCIPDLNAHFDLEYCQKQALYALFDGHAGVQVRPFNTMNFNIKLTTL